MTKTLVMVLGMHRSGTSALAGSLAALGLNLGTRLVPPGPDNPKGFFEHDAIWRIHQNLLEQLGSEWHDIRSLPSDWLTSAEAQHAQSALIDVITKDFKDSSLWVLKDPRLSRLLPLWQPIWTELDLEPKIIRLLRHPQEVAASLIQRDGLGMSHALALWLRYTLDAEHYSQWLSRSLVPYTALLENWQQVMAQVNQDLGLFSATKIEQNAAAIDAFLDQGLRHHQKKSTAISNRRIVILCNQLYEALLRQSQDSAATQTCTAAQVAILDTIALQEQIAHHLQQCQKQKKYISFLQDQQAESDRDYQSRIQKLQASLAGSEEYIQIISQHLQERDSALSTVSHSQTRRWSNRWRKVKLYLRKKKDPEEKS